MKDKNIDKCEQDNKYKDAAKMLEMYMQLPPHVRERIKYMTEGAALVSAIPAEETA